MNPQQGVSGWQGMPGTGDPSAGILNNPNPFPVQSDQGPPTPPANNSPQLGTLSSLAMLAMLA